MLNSLIEQPQDLGDLQRLASGFTNRQVNDRLDALVDAGLALVDGNEFSITNNGRDAMRNPLSDTTTRVGGSPQTAPKLAVEVFVITGTQIGETGTLSWEFMMRDDVPFDRFGGISNRFGFLRNKHDSWFIDMVEVGPDSRFHPSAGQQAEGQDGLERLLRSSFRNNAPAVLLMRRTDFDKFQAVAEALGIKLGAHHHDGTLTTS